MGVESFYYKWCLSESGDNPCASESLRELLEYRAREKDNELKNQLLKELVLKYSAAERELAKLNRTLVEKQLRLDEDLRVAAGIQRTLLPSHMPATEKLEISWKFLPCELIGGDIFNVVPLDEEHFGVYMIDVSGHGVPAALMTVSVSQALQPHSGFLKKSDKPGPRSHELVSPKNVLSALDEEYPFERFDMFFTIIYTLINVQEGYMIHGSAGHPPAVLLHSDGSLELLNIRGPIIGLGGLAPFGEERKELRGGDKLIYYTDGIIEYRSPSGEFYGKERFYTLLKHLRDEPVGVILEEAIESLMKFGDRGIPQDDVSLFGLEFKGSCI